MGALLSRRQRLDLVPVPRGHELSREVPPRPPGFLQRAAPPPDRGLLHGSTKVRRHSPIACNALTIRAGDDLTRSKVRLPAVRPGPPRRQFARPVTPDVVRADLRTA